MSDNQQNPKATKSNKHKEKKSSSFAGFLLTLISLLALVLAGGGITLGYKAWLDMNKRIDQAAVDRQSIAHEIETVDENIKLQNFKKQITSDIDNFGQRIETLANEVKKQADTQQDISLTTQETLALVNRSQLAWGLKEVEHVLRMANHRLRIERDVAGSITALNAADKRLNELKDPRLIPIRESISKQVGKLKNFPYPDWVGISLQLDNVLDGLKKNVIKTAKNSSIDKSDPNQTPSPEEEITGWRKLVDGVKNSINESIQVTKEEQRLKLFISQQESQQAYEYLRSKLLSTKYAVASRDDEAYHRELDAALAWLATNETLSGKKEIIAELEELNDINLEPELPDITEASILLIDTYVSIEGR